MAAAAGATRVKIKFHGITYANYKMNTRTRYIYIYIHIYERSGLVVWSGIWGTFHGVGHPFTWHNELNAFAMPNRSFLAALCPLAAGCWLLTCFAVHSYSFIDDYCVNYYPVRVAWLARRWVGGILCVKLQKECQLFSCKTDLLYLNPVHYSTQAHIGM